MCWVLGCTLERSWCQRSPLSETDGRLGDAHSDQAESAQCCEREGLCVLCGRTEEAQAPWKKGCLSWGLKGN